MAKIGVCSEPALCLAASGRLGPRPQNGRNQRNSKVLSGNDESSQEDAVGCVAEALGFRATIVAHASFKILR